jgi:hypothetical protein
MPFDSEKMRIFAELNQLVHGMAQNIYQHRIGASRYG